MHALGPDQLHGYVRREIGDHSPNWIGIPRHDMGALAGANDPFRASLELSGEGRSAYELKDVDVARRAIDILQEFAERCGRGDDRPFALTVGLMLPHPPYAAQPEDFGRYSARVPAPTIPPPSNGEHPWIAWWRSNRGIRDVTDTEADRARTAYYALTSRMDSMIGEILDALDALNLAGDTLVVYTSDHGDHLGERGLWWKHTFFDESAKVPLVLAWPGRLAEGDRRAAVVNLIDLVPTILEGLAAPALPNIDGRSFLPLALDPSARWLGETFSEYCTDKTPAWTGGMAVQQRMIRTERYKLNYYHGYPPQLFDMAEDPQETRDLAGDARHSAVRETLLRRLLAGWDPDLIARRMANRTRDKEILGAWAAATNPDDTYLWKMLPDHNQLARRAQ